MHIDVELWNLFFVLGNKYDLYLRDCYEKQFQAQELGSLGFTVAQTMVDDIESEIGQLRMSQVVDSPLVASLIINYSFFTVNPLWLTLDFQGRS